MTATGCSDDDEPTTDGGTTGEDGGTTGEDASTTGEEDAGEEMCPGLELDEDGCIDVGGEKCCSFFLAIDDVCPCVFEKQDGSEVCGVNADDIAKINPSSQFEGCVEADVSGIESDAAGAYFDRTASDDKSEAEIQHLIDETCDYVDTDTPEDDTVEDGKFNLVSTLGGLSYNGCCTEAGQFGVNLSASNEYPDVNAHLGCRGFGELQASLSSEETANEEPCKDKKDEIDAAADRNAGQLPFCDPTTGEAGCPPVMTALCGILPESVGLPISCPMAGADPTPSWICAAVFMDGTVPSFPDDCVPLLPDTMTSCPVDGQGVPQTNDTCVPVPAANELPGCEGGA